MERSPEMDFACTAKTFCPCQGVLSQACRSLVLFGAPSGAVRGSSNRKGRR